jgi:NDP-sugar pyrophosphorylase family protein
MITQAFVLGAGLGTRLRPLTDDLPKPLVPIFQKPLITFAFDHLVAAGCSKLVVNTHHRPECFAATFGKGETAYRDVPLTLVHEPVLLETGGGIANVAHLLGWERFVVYNSDILTDLSLEQLVAAHEQAGNLVTLALRSHGGPQQVGFEAASGRIIDINNQLGRRVPLAYLFSGVYVVEPELQRWLTPGAKRSIISTFVELIRRDEKIGGVLLDEGQWWDVGTRAAYMQLHRELPRKNFPRYDVADRDWRAAAHRTARVADDAQLHGCTVIGAEATVENGARLDDTIVWPGAQIASRSLLKNCIVRTHRRAEGQHNDADI